MRPKYLCHTIAIILFVRQCWQLCDTVLVGTLLKVRTLLKVFRNWQFLTLNIALTSVMYLVLRPLLPLIL